MKIYPARIPPESLGARIKRIRTARGWSVRDIAARAAVSAATISRVERDADLTVSALREIARALEIDVTELIGGCDLDAINS